MRIVSHPADLQTGGQPVAVALGFFDGVHLGHQALLELALTDARRHGALALAVTFDRHPNAVIAPDRCPPQIQSLSHRLQLIQTLGLNAALVIPFTHAFSQLSAHAFLQSLAHDLHPLRSLSVGEGFTFGHQRQGNVSLLQTLGPTFGFHTQILPPVCLDHTPVRSTRIRELIRCGELQEVGRLLGRPYTVAGTVLHGDGIGRTLGYPTANVDVSGLVLPPNGVYTALAHLPQASHPALVNLGLRPTLNQPHPTLHFEAHLLEYHADLYGSQLEVQLIRRLRDERRFPSRNALQQQIAADVQAARLEFQLPQLR